MQKPIIGFIGLGQMGAAMVQCLQDNNYDVIVLGNKTRTHLDAAIARGANEALNAKHLAQECDIIMLCMGTSQQVEQRVYGDEGIIAGLKPGTIIIDFGTSLPASTQKIGADIAAQGSAYMDAPLGRTPAHAVDGLLNIMCGGDKETFERAKPTLDVLGENVFHLGALGTGHTIKLINNFFGMTTATAMSEAFAMADMAGIDRQKIYEVMAAGPLHSGMMDFVAAYAIENDPTQLGFAIKNANKDVGYYLTMADDLKAKTHIACATAQSLKSATDHGIGEENVCKMVDFFTQQKT